MLIASRKEKPLFHFEMLPAEECCSFLPGQNLPWKWGTWVTFLCGPDESPATSPTFQAHAVSMLLWTVLGGNVLLLKFCHSLERKTGFLVPEKDHESQSWDTVFGQFLNIIQNMFFTKDRNNPWSKNQNTFPPSSWLVLNCTLICKIKRTSFSR